MVIHHKEYVARLETIFESAQGIEPWQLLQKIEWLIGERLSRLGPDYKIFNNVAIHKSVVIDSHAQIKGPAVISENCFIGPNTLLRGGIFLDHDVSIGPGCEIKSALVFSKSALAHFNFVGDSIVGSDVNLEAGAVVANHYNERENKEISVFVEGHIIPTGSSRFGSLIGDNSKIGANSVLSPGTILIPGSIVKRLALVDQCNHESSRPT